MSRTGAGGGGRVRKGWGCSTFGHMRQAGQELIEFLLAIGQFTAAAVVDAEAVHDAVDYQEAEFVAGEGVGERVEELELVLFWGVSLGRGRRGPRGLWGREDGQTSLLRARA